MSKTLETLTTELLAAMEQANTAEIARLAVEINALLPVTPVTRKAWDAQTGDKVRGEYMGKAYSGTVAYRRFHTCNPNWMLVSVTLDTPLAVWGENDLRDGIMLTIDSNGQGEIETMILG